MQSPALVNPVAEPSDNSMTPASPCDADQSQNLQKLLADEAALSALTEAVTSPETTTIIAAHITSRSFMV